MGMSSPTNLRQYYFHDIRQSQVALSLSLSLSLSLADEGSDDSQIINDDILMMNTIRDDRISRMTNVTGLVICRPMQPTIYTDKREKEA